MLSGFLDKVCRDNQISLPSITGNFHGPCWYRLIKETCRFIAGALNRIKRPNSILIISPRDLSSIPVDVVDLQSRNRHWTGFLVVCSSISATADLSWLVDQIRVKYHRKTVWITSRDVALSQWQIRDMAHHRLMSNFPAGMGWMVWLETGKQVDCPRFQSDWLHKVSTYGCSF